MKLLTVKKLLQCRVFSVIEKKYRVKKDTFTRTIVAHKGAVAILPVLKNDRIILLKQYRPALDKTIYEVPAGTLEKGENPLLCARRELEEETGYRAKKFKKVISVYIAPGYSTEILTVFIATDLSRGNFSPEKYESIKPIEIPFDKAISYIKSGKISDAKTIISLLYYSSFLKNNQA